MHLPLAHTSLGRMFFVVPIGLLKLYIAGSVHIVKLSAAKALHVAGDQHVGNEHDASSDANSQEKRCTVQVIRMLEGRMDLPLVHTSSGQMVWWCPLAC